MPGTSTRDGKLVVRISSNILEKVRVQAEQRGVTMSALAAWVIGEWITQQDRLGPFLEVMGKQLGEVAKEAAQEAVKGP